MTAVETYIPTAHGSRYLQQLCKHWSHRLDVSFTPVKAFVPFAADSVCMLNADDGGLGVRIEAPDVSAASRLSEVVFTHVERFAFRENLERPIWRQA
ncbi:MAG: DUF2218 domain-containing protein [Pseudomonadota bacterium]